MHAYIYSHSQRLIDEFPGYEVPDISILKSQCANMNFFDQIIYNIMFQNVVHKRGESEIKYIKIFKNYKALAISVGNSYTEDQMIQNFLDNLKQGGKYSLSDRNTPRRIEKRRKIIDQKSLSISELQIDYFNLDNSVRNN